MWRRSPKLPVTDPAGGQEGTRGYTPDFPTVPPLAPGGETEAPRDYYSGSDNPFSTPSTSPTPGAPATPDAGGGYGAGSPYPDVESATGAPGTYPSYGADHDACETDPAPVTCHAEKQTYSDLITDPPPVLAPAGVHSPNAPETIPVAPAAATGAAAGSPAKIAEEEHPRSGAYAVKGYIQSLFILLHWLALGALVAYELYRNVELIRVWDSGKTRQELAFMNVGHERCWTALVVCRGWNNKGNSLQQAPGGYPEAVAVFMQGKHKHEYCGEKLNLAPCV